MDEIVPLSIQVSEPIIEFETFEFLRPSRLEEELP